MTLITFLHAGHTKCPKCGTIGDARNEKKINYFECPLCNTEFTDEIILSEGVEIELTNN
ncbi:MAG: hypothetical protein KAI18_01135 [Candidatus Aenigmarchaeota archaeon]|nr:hypothetical protein [Candidatus Aenigmarchaeota archaeon]